MHITFRQEPVHETRVNLNLSIEETKALYWSIYTANPHMQKWLSRGQAEAFADIAQDIEGELHSRLVDTGNDPDADALDAPREQMSPLTVQRFAEAITGQMRSV